MSVYKLVSFNLCPFVQRSIITLLAKGVEHELVYIDLANKPEWFLVRSPFGALPILIVDEDTTLFESSAICEYIDETSPGRRLHPEDALERAVHRGWIEVANALLGSLYSLMVAQEEDAAMAARERVLGFLRRFEDQLDGGIYFGGDDICLVDAAIAPGFHRLAWIVAAVPELDVYGDLPKVTAWADALVSHPAVRGSIEPDLEQAFHAHLRGEGGPTPRAPTWLARRSA